METVQSPDNQTTENGRAKEIGGSSIAAVMGLNRWKTPLALWAEMQGLIKPDDDEKEWLEIGRDLEAYVCEKFQQRSGKKLRRDARTFRDEQYPYMVAHIDRWICGEDALFEAKTASAWKAKEWVGEEIPQEYILQVMWYMGILKKSKAYLACLIGGQKFAWKEIDFDADLFAVMRESARVFMENFIVANVAPIAIAGDSDTLAQMFPQSQSNHLHMDDNQSEVFNRLADEREQLKDTIKTYTASLEDVEAKIKQIIGENESAESDKYKVTWKTQDRKEYTVKATSFRVMRVSLKK